VGEDPRPSFATLTHARLRASQGDVRGALRILQVILDVQPEHAEARGLLEALKSRVAVIHAEPAEESPEPVVAATTSELSGGFRDALGGGASSTPVARLSRWLERIQRNRMEADHVRQDPGPRAE
jgi:hypothetical protein